ncbi:MAG TPA: cyanophycinase [Steroidobacteraceae bacterium]|nr:cyanophycinase [Steroidobacteraceae bacterium]
MNKSVTLLVTVTATWAMLWPAANAAPPARPVHHQGTLLLIGGGLDDDNRPVYERFLTLAAAHGPAHIVIATAATGDQEREAIARTEALRTWAPRVDIEVVRRETGTAATVAAIDRATAMFFTGGDQQRITARYRPHDQATPEWEAMRRLLARGGVIAGTSAGDAMMGEVMFLGGGSATALGATPGPAASPPREDDDEEDPAQLGPRVGPGMRLMPGAISDSHFFERDRIGRLVAALEASGRRLGIGVGEDAAVELDLDSGELRGISVSESLLIDIRHLRRNGTVRSGVVARLVAQGDRIRLADWPMHRAPVPAPSVEPMRVIPVTEPGQNRQLAAWRMFRQARDPASPPMRQQLQGYTLTVYPAGSGDVALEINTASATPNASSGSAASSAAAAP